MKCSISTICGSITNIPQQSLALSSMAQLACTRHLQLLLLVCFEKRVLRPERFLELAVREQDKLMMRMILLIPKVGALQFT